MSSWGCWRRVGGATERGGWGGRSGDPYFGGKEDVAVLPRSLLLRNTEVQSTGTKKRVDPVSSQPRRSVVVAAAAAWRTNLRLGRTCKPVPPPVHSTIPCPRGLSTNTLAPSRRHLVSPRNEDGKEEKEEDEEAEACISGGGGEDEAETEFEGSQNEEWEEEDNAEPEIGDGGDGGGIVLGDVGWGEHALSIANEILCLHFDKDTKMFAFKVSPRGYIYVRLDKLSNQYGCPTMEEIEQFSILYKKRLDESGENGELPDDLALEVSSPGAERLLKVPEDLDRFKEMPMMVRYMEEDPESGQGEPNDGVFLLEAVEAERRHCVWKLANVRENRDHLGKGRPLSRKRKDWRLRVPFEMLKRVMLYVP